MAAKRAHVRISLRTFGICLKIRVYYHDFQHNSNNSYTHGTRSYSIVCLGVLGKVPSRRRPLTSVDYHEHLFLSLLKFEYTKISNSSLKKKKFEYSKKKLKTLNNSSLCVCQSPSPYACTPYIFRVFSLLSSLPCGSSSTHGSGFSYVPDIQNQNLTKATNTRSQQYSFSGLDRLRSTSY